MPRDESYDTGAPIGQEYGKESDLFDMSPNDIVKQSQTATTGGRKFDGDKLEYGLTPPLALKAMVDVLTFGAQKYERDNWKRVPDSKRRYFDALQRHVWAWKEGESIDPESGKHHLAHAMCCLAFLYEHDVKYSLDKQENGDV
jgi:hypothetical protein